MTPSLLDAIQNLTGLVVRQSKTRATAHYITSSQLEQRASSNDFTHNIGVSMSEVL